MTIHIQNGIPTLKRLLTRLGLAVLFSVLSSCTHSYPYHVSNENCSCEEYTFSEKEYNVSYQIRAEYRIDDAIITTIELEIFNNGKDTVLLDLGAVKISSRNIAYQYNDRFVPFPARKISPHRSDILIFEGHDNHPEENERLKIAGEQLTLTLKGIYAGTRRLSEHSITFIPYNPYLRQFISE